MTGVQTCALPIWFLLENLEGGIAWKEPEQALRQKERLRALKEKKEQEPVRTENAEDIPEELRCMKCGCRTPFIHNRDIACFL